MRLKKALKLKRTERFKKSVLDLDLKTRQRLKKQLKYLVNDPRHPSLKIKKIKETRSVFEGCVNDSHRFTFQFGKESEIILRLVGLHNSALKKP